MIPLVSRALRRRLPVLSRDGWLIIAAAGVRTLAFGFLSVVLGLYLADLGFTADLIGVIFAVSVAGGTAMTLLLSTVADRLGRRRVVLAGALLMAVGGTVYTLTDSLFLLMIAAVLGTMSPGSRDVGPFMSLEQAILAQTTRDENRTSVFAAYNIIGSVGMAIGALIVGIPALAGMSASETYRALLLSYVAAAGVLFALFACLSPVVEAPVAQIRAVEIRRNRLGLHRSSGVVAKLSALLALDAFAGAFTVHSLIAYWFHLRYGVDTGTLAVIFFVANIFSAISLFAAAPIARRIGLLNTIVFTHLPGNVLMVLVPLMPSLPLALVVLLIRYLFSTVDVPTRQSYTMAVVAADERTAAAGITSTARNAAASIPPVFTGATFAIPALGIPFIVSGVLKIIYDLAMFFVLRNVRPPEELASVPVIPWEGTPS